MSDEKKNTIKEKLGEANGFIKTKIDIAKDSASKIGTKALDGAKSGANSVTEFAKGKIAKIKSNSVNQKNEKENDEPENVSSNDKKKSLDEQLKIQVAVYNDAYAQMNDKGTALYMQRTRAIDIISNIEKLINSIANRPKSFDVTISEISSECKEFTDVTIYAKEELDAAKKSAMSASAGVASGMAVASLTPTAAMWVATTFGTASTGTAISALSGAAAESAALAWLGGGSLAAGGGGMASGQAFLAMAGPIGWTVAGATLLTSIVLFANKKVKLNKKRAEEIEAVIKNIEIVRETDSEIETILTQTQLLRDELSGMYDELVELYGKDFMSFSDSEQMKLGVLVNNTKALSLTLKKNVE